MKMNEFDISKDRDISALCGFTKQRPSVDHYMLQLTFFSFFPVSEKSFSAKERFPISVEFTGSLKIYRTSCKFVANSKDFGTF